MQLHELLSLIKVHRYDRNSCHFEIMNNTTDKKTVLLMIFYFRSLKFIYARVQKFPNLSKISTKLQKIFTALEQCDNHQLIIQSWTHAGIQPIIENGVVTHVEVNATGILDGEAVADLQEEETNGRLRGRRPNKAPWGLMNAGTRSKWSMPLLRIRNAKSRT